MQGRWIQLCVCVAIVLVPALPTVASAADVVDAGKVEQIAGPLVDGGFIEGLAIGFVDEKGTQTLGLGKTSAENPSPPTPETVFEIGSITKTFTGIILAQLVEEGKLKLDDPAQQHLGMTMFVPRGKPRPITLGDLATHSSGLPRMPSNFTPKDPANPYADYTVAQMGSFLMKHKLARQPGEKSEYSNLGMGLLGHILQLKSGLDYESLLEKTITVPLGMTHTKITLDDDDLVRLAPGHNFDGEQVANWDLPTLAGAGAIRSTSGDMLKYLSANLGLTHSELDKAIALSHKMHFETDDTGNGVGLGWQIQQGGERIWHNGGTGGYSSFCGMLPEKKVGVIVLGNTASDYVTKLGFKLLKLAGGDDVEPFKLPVVTPIAEEKLEPLVGKYKLNIGLVADVTREKDRLFVQLTGQPRIGLYATSDTNFYCRPVDAQFDFEADDSGKFNKLVIHQGGMDIPGERIAGEDEAGDDKADKPAAEKAAAEQPEPAQQKTPAN